MKTAAIVCILSLAAVNLAAAGYTDDLWNESEDRVYFDCGDWSGVENHKDTSFGSHYYFYSKHRSNWQYMFTAENWGYPDNANLKTVTFGNVAWSAVYIHGFDKTLNVDGNVYTDNPTKINYKTSYLRYSGWSTIYWTIYDIGHIVTQSDTGDRVTVKNKITFYGTHVKEGKDDYKDVISTPSDSIGYVLWKSVNPSVEITLSNHSDYVILTIPTPQNVTGIKIFAESENTTAVYEKHVYCLKLNTSEDFKTCDLVEYEYHNFTGVSPFGTDTYLLPYEPDYTINVTLYTPFETINATVNVTETDVEPVNTDLRWEDGVWDLLYLFVPLGLIFWLVGLI